MLSHVPPGEGGFSQQIFKSILLRFDVGRQVMGIQRERNLPVNQNNRAFYSEIFCQLRRTFLYACVMMIVLGN